MKQGARHSAVDMANIQAMHDMACQLGAQCPGNAAEEMDESPDVEMQEQMTGMEKSAVKIAKRDDTKPTEGESEYGDVKFADPKNKKYPIDTEEHIRAAWNYINKPDSAAQYSAADVDTIKGHIIAAWKDKIDKAGPPSAEKSFNFTYIKSLHLSHDEQFLRDVVAVKSIGKDDIHGYLALWGDAKTVDLDGEYFTPQTNFWNDRLGYPRPLTWDHAQDKTTKSNPIIGGITQTGIDEIGMWYDAQLDVAHQYRKAIDKLVSERDAGTSSDSVPQYIEREQTGKSVWLKTWPLFGAALTVTPCEPRMLTEGSPIFKAVTQRIEIARMGKLDSLELDSLMRLRDVIRALHED